MIYEAHIEGSAFTELPQSANISRSLLTTLVNRSRFCNRPERPSVESGTLFLWNRDFKGIPRLTVVFLWNSGLFLGVSDRGDLEEPLLLRKS